MIIVLTCRPRIRMRGAQPPLPFAFVAWSLRYRASLRLGYLILRNRMQTFRNRKQILFLKRWVLFRKIENGKSAKA